MGNKRDALIVANSDYEDSRLRALTSPQSDAVTLSRVLNDSEIGGFTVKTVINQPHFIVRREVEAFFKDRSRDDLLLLYFSGHGIKDEDGRLYIATTDTHREWLASTAVEAEFVHRAMEKSFSRRQVLILDCCYSGAFGRSMFAKSDDSVATGEQFGGRGRVVLTASDAVQYAFEGSSLADDNQPSMFTQALIRGLETGEADLNKDGFIDVDEWYTFAHEQVVTTTPNQRPGKWSLDVSGSLFVARNQRADLVAVTLPPEITQVLESPLAYIREGAVHELAKLLVNNDKRVSLAAVLGLERLAMDDSKRVSTAATQALEAHRGVEIEKPPPELTEGVKSNAPGPEVPGVKTDESNPVESLPSVRCPFCKAAVPDEARFCPGCDAPRTAVRTWLEGESTRTGVPYEALLKKERDEDARNPVPLDVWTTKITQRSAH